MGTRAGSLPAPAGIPAAPPDRADEAGKRAITHALRTGIRWPRPTGP